MSKPSAMATISPISLGVGAEVLADDLVDVIGQLNWSFQNRPRLHISAVVGANDWAAGGEVGTARIMIPASSSFGATALMFRIRVRPEVEEIEIGARTWFDPATSDAGEVEFTVGAAVATLVGDHSQNADEIAQTITTATSGTGSLLCSIRLRRTAGSSTTNFLRNIRVEDLPVATLPDPGTD